MMSNGGENEKAADPKSGNPEAADELECYPAWLKTTEGQAVAVRREALKADPDAGSSGLGQTIGLAIAGGGIRSATFALGILQALARQKRLRCIDFMSTVSGGGYIGGFLGALYLRALAEEDGSPPGGTTAVESALTRFPESFPIRWLRRNGRYLSPTGPGG